MHGRVLFLLGDLLAANTSSQPVTSSRGGFRNFLGPLDEGDRYTAGGLISPGGSDDELRRLMQKLARRIWRASQGQAFWSQSKPLACDSDRWENPHLPSGYTYLLQFIAHDMVDSVCSATAEGVRPGVANARNRPLALDAIYGSGPDEFPQAYGFDEVHEHNQTQLPRAGLRVGPRREAAELSTFACPFRDIARGRTSPKDAEDGGNRDGLLREALVADPRNDDNFIVSQLTVVWHLLHNHVLSLLPAPEDSMRPILNSRMALAYRHFFCARLAVTLLYRNIIVQDVLPSILHPAVRDHYLFSDFDGQRRWNFRINADALKDREDGIPLEFSHGAFRFGHAMVRDRYRLNSNGETDLVIKHTSNVQPREFFLPTRWMVDWARFFPIKQEGVPAPNKSQRIGPNYASVLHNSAALQRRDPQDPNSPDFHGLPNREFLSAGYAHVWSVPSLFEKLGALELDHLALGLESPFQTPRAPYDVWRGPIREWLHASPGQKNPLTETDIDRLVNDPPLPFFVLFEAAYVLRNGVPQTESGPTGGAHLGPLGSIIVAETMCGALTRHSIAFETAGSTLKKRLEQCCSVLLGAPHADALACLAAIATMPDLICFMIDEDVFSAQRSV